MQLRNSQVQFKRLPSSTFYQKIYVGGVALHLADDLSMDSWECEVIDVGPGEIMPNGEREEMGVTKGMMVIIPQGMGQEVGDGTYLVDVSVIEAEVIRCEESSQLIPA